MKLHKPLMMAFAIVYASVSFAQKSSITPRFTVFDALREKYEIFDSLAEKNKVTPLNNQQLEMFLETSANLRAMIENGWQQYAFVGYLKRVQASICFETVNVLMHTTKYQNNDKVLLNQMAGLLHEGLDDMHKYTPQQYPQYLITDIDYTHPAANETDVATHKMTLKLDEMNANRLLGLMNEKLGNIDEAVNNFYEAFNKKGNVTTNLLEEASSKLMDDSYRIAMNIFNSCNAYKKYDERFYNFCINMHKYPDMLHEAELGLKNMAARQNDNVKIRVSFSIPDDLNSYNDKGDWLLIINYKLDSKNMLVPQSADLNEYKYPTRAYFDMAYYAMKRVIGNVKGDTLIAAEAIINKHFNDVVELLKVWGKNSPNCYYYEWVSKYMNTYTLSEENKNWITKKLKKCK